MKKTKIKVLVAVLAAMSVLAVGCGEKKEATPSTAPVASEAPAVSATPAA